MSEARPKAAFLDRDGVINIDVGYLHRTADLALVPRADDALAAFAAAGFLLVIVTNQSGIGRGYYDADDFRRVTRALEARLRERGVVIAATYHCPHVPNGGCDCRKPLPGMLLQAIADFGIDPSESLMIGDKPSDIAAGRAAGVRRCYRIGDSDVDVGDADGLFGTLWECACEILAG